MTEYGLPSVRDKNGELQAVEHAFTFGGQDITIKLLPPTISEFEEFEEFADKADVDPDKLEDIVRRHIIKPDIPEDKSLTFREITAYAKGIQDFSAGGSGVTEEIAEQLDELESKGN